MRKVGFGGGCHWCTEAVFQSLVGVIKVEQGFIAPLEVRNAFSEAVVVHFNQDEIGLKNLIEIHLRTHNSTSAHSMRDKYRSAIYAFDEVTRVNSTKILEDLQSDFEDELITKTLRFGEFKFSDSRFHNYYRNDAEKPFCKTYIAPKLQLLLRKFSKHINPNTINTPHELI